MTMPESAGSRRFRRFPGLQSLRHTARHVKFSRDYAPFRDRLHETTMCLVMS